jgi:hypothetical protein
MIPNQNTSSGQNRPQKKSMNKLSEDSICTLHSSAQIPYKYRKNMIMVQEIK